MYGNFTFITTGISGHLLRNKIYKNTKHSAINLKTPRIKNVSLSHAGIDNQMLDMISIGIL